MDMDEFRLILKNSGVDVWTFIETAVTVAVSDFGKELKNRREGIIERLYAPVAYRCSNCNIDLESVKGNETKMEKKHQSRAEASVEKDSSSHEGKERYPLTPQSMNSDEDQDPIDEELTKILAIKEYLEDIDQPEDSLVNLLQNLADMDITFKALKETDIGRHVKQLGRHPSNEIRRLVKHLVRKWKDLVDEWVKTNTPEEIAASSNIAADGDSPQQNPLKNTQIGSHQVPDFAYSPNPLNASSSSDKNNSELELRGKVRHRGETQPKPTQTTPASSHNKQREQRENTIDAERFASARRRLHENYQEAENAKKQRTIQVMDLQDIPKPKNSFFAKKRGSHGRH